MLIATGLVGGTLLRAAIRVFAGVGATAPPDPAGDEAQEESPDREQAGRGASPLLWIVAALLTAGAAAWGVLPGLPDAARAGAAAFVDQPGYAAAVLGGAAPAAPAHAVAGPGATAYLYALGSLALAGCVAAGALARPLPPAAGRAVDALRAIHDGRPGDYVAWTVGGTAVLGTLFALLLRS